MSSADTGRHQIYVLPFPALDTRWQVSTEGGNWPRWRTDGRELYYVSEDRKLMSVRVAAGDAFEAAPPSTLFALPLRTIDLEPNAPSEYSVAANGDRFVICQVQDASVLPSITLVTDWKGLIQEP